MYEIFNALRGKIFQSMVGREVLVAAARDEHVVSHLEYGLRERVRCLQGAEESGIGNDTLCRRF